MNDVVINPDVPPQPPSPSPSPPAPSGLVSPEDLKRLADLALAFSDALIGFVPEKYKGIVSAVLGFARTVRNQEWIFPLIAALLNRVRQFGDDCDAEELRLAIKEIVAAH